MILAMLSEEIGSCEAGGLVVGARQADRKAVRMRRIIIFWILVV
jgi:hypothetical protein